MSVDVFGRQLGTDAVRSIGSRDAPGEGFKYPEEDNDAISLKMIRNMLKEELRLIYNVTGSMGGRIDGIETIIQSFQMNFLKTMRRKNVGDEEVQEQLNSHSGTIQHITEELTTLKDSIAHETKMDNKKATVVEELHRPARRNYPRRRVEVRGLDETWQADLVDMSAYYRENGGYKFLLTVIDIFSKYAWAVPTKTKNGKDVSSAMKSILEQGRVPQKLHVDRGKEFYNSQFKRLMQNYSITMYSTFSNLKASICERFNRTLKEKMWKQFSLQGTYKWIPIVTNLVQSYNNTKHRTIKMKPKDVTAAHEKYLLHHVFGQLKTYNTKKIKFKVGDKVRVSKYKNVFQKGYTPNWTTEIFTISQVVKTNPVTYKLTDYEDNPIEGGFYQEELTRVTNPDVYLIEKILRRCGNKAFVKWLGFDSSHNSWINKDELNNN
ncbi:uncharacterized protein LOC107045691 [Diachasma alloeum]|uniref:uncharacterized protein LOC107045691 n=1 Tax=Diachasma alloeum TaxID=454923 RepID=UPI0007384652|nr:uncharacterized protein LOC107045691 [Diachasma alloeum]